jgi:predicted regulator of Ras-like GTPase activity (Roadblock/LC7/MglB family)
MIVGESNQMSKHDEMLQNAMKKLSPHAIEAAIVSIGGLSMASYSMYGDEEIRHHENRTSGMSAAGLSFSERICNVLSNSEVRETIIIGTNGVFIIVSNDSWVLGAKVPTLSS